MSRGKVPSCAGLFAHHTKRFINELVAMISP
jgi:hypothetical protein